MRLDVKVASMTLKSREYARKLIESGFVFLNDKPATKRSLVILETDSVEIRGEIKDAPSSLKPNKIPLEIVFEDEFLMVINKESGISTHPPSIYGENTVANAVVEILQKEGVRPGIIHRLDKDTTGLLIIAKTEDARTKMSELIANREVERKYLGLCYGEFNKKSFKIDANIGRDLRNRLKMKVLQTSGKNATTNVFLKERFHLISLVEFKLETGRTHQIRLHMEYNKTPIVGDQTYGLKPPSFFAKFNSTPELKKALEGVKRQMLHAFSLKFFHPFTNEEIILEAPLPSDFQNIYNLLSSNKS